jgi:hypothetical protein
MYRIVAVLFGLMFGGSSVATAACRGHIPGPLGGTPSYYFSSSCFNVNKERVRLKHQVCSVSRSTIAFNWTKVNWASGSTGVEFGGCLVRERYAFNAIRVGGSVIKATVGLPYDTDVYVADLGKDQNKAYTETIEGGGPRIDGGVTVEPFHFRIQYTPATEKKTVRIQATMVGQKPFFVVVLPRSIKTQADLNAFISSDHIKRISPLVKFDEKPIKGKTSSNDIPLMDFYKDNNFAERGNLTVGGEDGVSFDILVNGTVDTVVPEIAICVGQSELIATCFVGA